MSNFHIGQKVVCVNLDRAVKGLIGREAAITLGVVYPDIGAVYTVRGLYKSRSGHSGILLAELNNEKASVLAGFSREAGFLASWFRPLVTRKTDISVFTALLNTSREGVPA